jgi:hypothetical protein
VVWDTLTAKSRTRAIVAATRLVLPAPDGADMTNSWPCGMKDPVEIVIIRLIT